MPDFPQIPESDTGGETASIYAALRRTTGVPAVNLTWRLFAALPVLDLVRQALAPLLGPAELNAAPMRVAAGTDLPDCGPTDPDEAGIDDTVRP